MWNWQTREFPKNFFGNSKKSVRTFKLRIEPYFLSHAERGESLQNQDFVGGMQNRRRFAPTIFLVQKPFSKNCGEGEIRTHGALADTPVFKTGAIDHSATSPLWKRYLKPLYLIFPALSIYATMRAMSKNLFLSAIVATMHSVLVASNVYALSGD